MSDFNVVSPAIADSALTPERLARLRKLCETATPGPWEHGVGPYGRDVEAGGELIAEVIEESAKPRARTDAELIAEARSALPALLDAIERLRSGLEHIADGQECSNYTGPPWCRDDSGRSRDAKYGADRWCDTCIARDALTSAAVSSPETDQ